MTNTLNGVIQLRPEPKWGSTGEAVYDRTYSRTKADGTKENWYETVTRVVDGNLSLVDSRYIEDGEREALIDGIYNFRIIPAGRHLWMSGVEGRQFLFNCYVSGWGDKLSEHFSFTFNQLMEGGGVGANYSHKYVNADKYPVHNLLRVHIVCSDEHDDYGQLLEAGLLSTKYSPEFTGAIQVEDSREGWTNALSEVIDTATTFYPEGSSEWYDEDTSETIPEIVFDLSNLRASGKRIKTFGGTSAGPVPLATMLKTASEVLSEAWLNGMGGDYAMALDHAIATCVVSGNVRRSARMSIMHWADPGIDWFLQCKKSGLSHWSTNISVEIDNTFLAALRGESGNPGMDDHASRVYEAIVEGMLRNGEPGIWNSSLSNVGEPNPVTATNPCGEICLEGWENCNLGHVNLDAFVRSDKSVDWNGLLASHKLMTRFLMRATYGDISDPRTAAIVARNRRIGVGHFGFAGFLAKRGIKFSEATTWRRSGMENAAVPGVAAELRLMKQEVWSAAQSYSHQLRIPMPVKTTTVAPTGTIAKLAGRTEGIHPIYARYFIRRIRFSMVDADQVAQVDKYREMGYLVVEDTYSPNTWVVEIPTKEELVQELEDLGIHPSFLESVDEISLEDMLRVQRMYQRHYADNAVSFTVNVPKDKYDVAEVKDILLGSLAFLKGTTLMVDESRELAPYERITAKEYYDSEIQTVDASYDELCASGACAVR
jgi:ribonucleoside-triphosphate reductase (thioredoxin)